MDRRKVISAGRRLRRPEHRFFTEQKAWELQVVAIAPVIASEKLVNAVYQERSVTDPVRSSIAGWWNETYFFYVPLSVLPQYDAFRGLIEGGDLSTVLAASAADASSYYAGRGVNWVKDCRDVIVREWFRNEEEDIATTPDIRPGRPAVRIGIDTVLQSLTLDSALPGGRPALGTDQLAQEDAYRAWSFQRDQGLIQMEYEDWLMSFGVRQPEALRRRRPFLLRYIREWQYPSNTINDTTGLPVSAVSWALTERVMKPRYFSEPGFIVVLKAFRPKVYFGNQQAAAVSVIDRVRYFAPALLRDDPETSLRLDTATSSPIIDGVMAVSHWIDVRDLFIHGDQFIDGATTQRPVVSLPTAAAEKDYATLADAEALFTTAAVSFIRADGIVKFTFQAATEDAVDATART